MSNLLERLVLVMRKLGILRYGTKSYKYTSGKDMPARALLDDVYDEGVLTKKIPAFYVPILFHQRFNNRWYIEAGPQLGLIHQPTDIFKVDDYGGDLTYTRKTRGEYQYIDFGFYGAVGYKLMKKTKSTSLGIGYYIGLSDVAKDAYPDIKNSSFYLFCKIPIGVGKDVQKLD